LHQLLLLLSRLIQLHPFCTASFAVTVSAASALLSSAAAAIALVSAASAFVVVISCCCYCVASRSAL
jgi:hypothetical protein